MNLAVKCKPATVVLPDFALEGKKVSQRADDLCQESGAFLRGVVNLSYTQQIFYMLLDPRGWKAL